jgi:hypothetical protein
LIDSVVDRNSAIFQDNASFKRPDFELQFLMYSLMFFSLFIILCLSTDINKKTRLMWVLKYDDLQPYHYTSLESNNGNDDDVIVL